MKDFKTILSHLFYYLGHSTSRIFEYTNSYKAFTLYCYFMRVSVKLDVLGKVWFHSKEGFSEEKL